MLWSLLAQVVRLIVDVLTLRYTPEADKDLEVLVLRQQIRILERRVGKPVRTSRVGKLMLGRFLDKHPHCPFNPLHQLAETKG